MPKWQIGARVCRREDVFDRSSNLMTGTVIEGYSDLASRFGPYPELYVVEWDDGIRQRGFLRHGLDILVGPVSVETTAASDWQDTKSVTRLPGSNDSTVRTTR